MSNNFIKNKKDKSYDVAKLRNADFTQFITTEITLIGEKRRTLCPFHNENTPSFFIYKDNSYFCFGCRAFGNAIDFVMKKLGYPFQEACSILEDVC
jgi:DNA primase